MFEDYAHGLLPENIKYIFPIQIWQRDLTVW